MNTLDNEINYSFFIHMIYLEIGLIIFVVLAFYVLYILRNWQARQMKQYEREMLLAFKYPEKLKNLAIHYTILHAYINVANKINNKTSNTHISHWLTTVILPVIKKASESVFWYRRYLAAKAMQLSLTPIDEAIVEKLLHDDRPCVVVDAVLALQRAPSDRLVNALIDKIARYHRKNHEFYFDLFAVMPESIRDLIEKRLSYERRYAERALCYDLLRFFPKPRVYSAAYEDTKNTNLELAVAAVKHICRAEVPEKMLISTWLSDSREDLALLALAKIAENHWPKYMPQVRELLNSPSVRLAQGARMCLAQLERETGMA
jgi:hypothetical protein